MVDLMGLSGGFWMRLDGIEFYVLLELFCSAQTEMKSFVCLQGSTCKYAFITLPSVNKCHSLNRHVLT